MYHGEILIYNIIYLYSLIGIHNTLELDELKECYDDFSKYISKTYDSEIIPFDSAWSNFLKIYPEVMKSESAIEIEDYETLEEIYCDRLIPAFKFSDIDCKAKDLIFNTRVLDILDINGPYEDVKEFFQISQEIYSLYCSIAKLEVSNLEIKELVNNIRCLRSKLTQKSYLAMNNIIYAKIIATINYFNKQNSLEIEGYNPNQVWEIALFSSNIRHLSFFNYYAVSVIIPEIDYYDFNAFNLIQNRECFVNYFLINLRDFMQKNQELDIKDILIFRKYLLVYSSCNYDVEDSFLEHGNADELLFRDVSDLGNDAFKDFYQRAYKCSLNIIHSDSEILSNKQLYVDVIICALFLKTFFQLNKNEDITKDLMKTITTNNYYKNKDYTIMTNLIDEVILDSERNFGSYKV